MAQHAVNRAWGVDNSNWGVKMSNSAPQHARINRFGSAWRKLEDEVLGVVSDSEAEVDAVWTISGTIYRDKENPANELPEHDFGSVVRLHSGGFGVPDATYKIVSWFDSSDHFQARAYVFEQPHSAFNRGGEQILSFDIGDPQAPLDDFQVTIDVVEARTGLDFFPDLQSDLEEIVEGTVNRGLWEAD